MNKKEDLYCLLPPNIIHVSDSAFNFITEDNMSQTCDKKIINMEDIKFIKNHYFDGNNQEVYIYKDVSNNTFTCLSARSLYLLSILQKRIVGGQHKILQRQDTSLNNVVMSQEEDDDVLVYDSDIEEDEDSDEEPDIIDSFEHTSIIEEKMMRDVLEKQLLKILYPALHLTKEKFTYEEIKEKLTKTSDNKPIDYKNTTIPVRDISNQEQFNLPLERYIQILFWSISREDEYRVSVTNYMKQIVEKRALEILGSDSKSFIQNYLQEMNSQNLNIVLTPVGLSFSIDYQDEADKEFYKSRVGFKFGDVSNNTFNLSLLSQILFLQNREKKRGYFVIRSADADNSHMTIIYYEIINKVLYFTNYDPHGTYAESSTSKKKILEHLYPLFRQFAMRLAYVGKITSAYLANSSWGHYSIPHYGVQTYIEGIDPGLCTQISYFFLHTMIIYSMLVEKIIHNIENSDVPSKKKVYMLRKPISEWKIDFDIFFKTTFNKEEIYALILKFSENLYNEYFEVLYKQYPNKAKSVRNVIENMSSSVPQFKENYLLKYKVPYEQPKEDISEKRLKRLEKEYDKMKTQKIEESKKEKVNKKKIDYEKLIEKYDKGTKIKVGYPCFNDVNCNTGCCKEDIIENVKVCQLPINCKSLKKK